MAAKNITLAGDYEKGYIRFDGKKKGLCIVYNGFFSKKKYINKDTVQAVETVNEEISKSMGSGVARGLLGGAIFGGVGALAGTMSGKSKGLHTVSILFKDGTKCLCDLDDEMMKNLMIVMY